MKKRYFLCSILLLAIAISFWSCQQANSGIANDYINKGLTEADYSKGKQLIAQMQAAYGGKANWLAYTVGRFHQKADWYDNLALSGWDTLPQHFAMVSKLGTDDSELFLVNGHKKREHWGIENHKTYLLNDQNERVYADNSTHARKLVLKNYWFQFPFRIDEADIIAYAGTESLKGKTYDLVYATWEGDKANADFEQFILYLNQETHLIECLHFTVREALQVVERTSEFTAFKPVDQLILPHTQLVRSGSPQQDGSKLHENHYVDILMGTH